MRTRLLKFELSHELAPRISSQVRLINEHGMWSVYDGRVIWPGCNGRGYAKWSVVDYSRRWILLEICTSDIGWWKYRLSLYGFVRCVANHCCKVAFYGFVIVCKIVSLCHDGILEGPTPLYSFRAYFDSFGLARSSPLAESTSDGSLQRSELSKAVRPKSRFPIFLTWTLHIQVDSSNMIIRETLLGSCRLNKTKPTFGKSDVAISARTARWHRSEEGVPTRAVFGCFGKTAINSQFF